MTAHSLDRHQIYSGLDERGDGSMPQYVWRHFSRIKLDPFDCASELLGHGLPVFKLAIAPSRIENVAVRVASSLTF